MKKININILLFILFLSVFSVLNLLHNPETGLSELENRELSKMPAFSLQDLANGQYFMDLEEYYADSFILRETWVRTARHIENIRGFKDETGAVLISYNNGIAEVFNQPDSMISDEDDKLENEPEISHIIEPTADSSFETSGHSAFTEEVAPPNEETPVPSQSPEAAEKSKAFPEPYPTPTPKPSSKPVPVQSEPQKVGGLLLSNGRAMETHYFADSNCKGYAETLNRFQQKLPPEVKVYSLVAPVSIEFYNVEKFKDITSPQTRTISVINNYFNGSIIPVDAYTPISLNTDKYLYFRTDHHWTALGAYYAYTGFMSAIGDEPVSIEQYETEEVEGFLGSLYQSTLNQALESNPDTITIYKPFIEHEYTIYYEGPVKMKLMDMNRAKDQNKYRIFMSGDRPWSKITTNVKNGKKIVIIKDSYGNAFVPFLLPHYEEIYTVDPRQFKLNIIEFIQDNEIKEVLFLNYVNAIGQKPFLDLIDEMTVR